MAKYLCILLTAGLLAIPFVGVGMEQAEIDSTRKRAEQGRADAQFDLGLMYYLGNGVEQNYEEAVKWYNKAAGQGHDDAMENLGWCYVYGNGVAKDPVQAYVWFALAAKRGNKLAQEDLKVLASSLSPEQLAAAKKLAASRSPPVRNRHSPRYPKYPYPATGIHLF